LTACTGRWTLDLNVGLKDDSEVHPEARRRRSASPSNGSLPYVPAVNPEGDLRVVIADDHHFFREGLRGMLAAAGIDVVGEATDGAGALALTRKLEPDVVALDLNMPGASGVDTVRLIVAASPNVPVVVLTVSNDDADALDVLAAGACGYLLKDARADELVGALRQAAGGHAVLSREVLRRLAARVPPAKREPRQTGEEGPTLSPRELEVIGLIAEGADNAAIGRQLGISRHTVKQHVTNIFERLGVENRVQAAVLAVRRGLV
jgi:DNA-binding NarL/FixJ family response regulator